MRATRLVRCSIPSKLKNLVTQSAIKADLRQAEAAKVLEAVRLHFNRYENGSTVPGVYVYGGVGSGKSMLMDMLFEVVLLLVFSTGNQSLMP